MLSGAQAPSLNLTWDERTSNASLSFDTRALVPRADIEVEALSADYISVFIKPGEASGDPNTGVGAFRYSGPDGGDIHVEAWNCDL